MPPAPPDPQADLDRLEDAVREAQAAFRRALSAWKRASGKPPRFLHDRRTPRMRPDAFGQARVFAERGALVASLPGGGVGAELGVQRGHFSRVLLDTLAPERLHLFDLSDRLLRDDVRGDARTVLHLGDSSTTLAAQTDVVFDWIYIDGDHSYAGAMKDARAALGRIRPGGAIVFNDYTPWSPGEAMAYGVMAVVNELVNEGLEMTGVALSPSGYFDVALKAPDPASGRGAGGPA